MSMPLQGLAVGVSLMRLPPWGTDRPTGSGLGVTSSPARPWRFGVAQVGDRIGRSVAPRAPGLADGGHRSQPAMASAGDRRSPAAFVRGAHAAGSAGGPAHAWAALPLCDERAEAIAGIIRRGSVLPFRALLRQQAARCGVSGL